MDPSCGYCTSGGCGYDPSWTNPECPIHGDKSKKPKKANKAETPVTITLTFPDNTVADEFIGWFLDGGGEYEWNETMEMNDLPTMDVTFKPGKYIRALTIKPYEEE